MSRLRPALALLLLALCLGCGLYSLFRARFESGDIYPEYSSLRADPLGTMALFESLEAFPGLQVKRDFTDANRLPVEPHTTYLHLAAEPQAWGSLPQSLFREIENFLVRGGRLVVTFLPATREFHRAKPDPGPESESKEDEEHTENDPDTALSDRWGIDIGFSPSAGTQEKSFEWGEAERMADLPLPAMLEWHSGTVMKDLDSRWKVIYAREKDPVVVERSFGAGSIVFATDSYFLSNEALRSDRQPALLGWLIGPAARVVFDEAHLGIVEETGVATLMRRYRLYGVVAAALLLAGLFIWKNAFPLVPPREEEVSADVLRGRELAAGFINLLRRNIPRGDLLKVCFAEYEKSRAAGAKVTAADASASSVNQAMGGRPAANLELARAVLHTQEALPARERNPVAAYGEIARHLSRKPFPSPPVQPGPQLHPAGTNAAPTQNAPPQTNLI